MNHSTPLQVYVLIDDRCKPNEDYLRIFTSEPGFDRPVFSSTQYPTGDWVGEDFLNQEDSIELYNHYRLWVKSVNENKPIVILNNRSYPVSSASSDKVIGELIKAGQEINGTDLVYYGKYLDRCDQYQYDRTVIITDCDTAHKFPVYQTNSPYGLFAYLINPYGAKKLIDEVHRCPKVVEKLVNQMVDGNQLKAVVYHPSVIRIIDPHNTMFGYECREPECKPNCITWSQIFWAVVLVIVIILFIGLILYLSFSNFSNSPDQVINSGYTKCPKPKWVDLPQTYYSVPQTTSQVVQAGCKPTGLR